MPDFGDWGNEGPPEGSRYEYQGKVDPLAPSVANGQITPAQWAEYQAKRKRDAILGTLLTVGGMLGAQPAANALGIGASGAGAAGGASASAAPEFGVGAANTGIWGGAGMTPGVAGAGISGAGAAGAAGGAGSLFAGMSAKDLAGLGLGLAGGIGGAMSNGQNFTPTTATSDPQLQALMRSMQGRLDKSEPLYDSVLNMANGLLPTQYQKGGGGMP